MNPHSSKPSDNTAHPSHISRELPNASNPENYPRQHPQLVTTAQQSPVNLPPALPHNARGFPSSEVTAGAIYPPPRDIERLPSVRSIVSGVEIAKAVSPAEPYLYNNVRHHNPVHPAPTHLPSQRVTHDSQVYNTHPAVSTARYMTGSVENVAVSHQGHHYYTPYHPAYYHPTSQLHTSFRADQRVHAMSRETPGSFPIDHALAQPSQMDPTMAPYYFMGQHMQVADATTPAVNIYYPRIATSHHLPTAELQRAVNIENRGADPKALESQIGGQTGECINRQHVQGISPVRRVQQAAVGPSLSPVEGFSTQHPSVHASPHGCEGDEENERQNWSYIEPGTADAEGLTGAFLRQVTARACKDEEGRIRCSECEEEFGNLASWRRHASRSHRAHQSVKVRCPICRIELRNEGNVKRHMKTVHKDVSDPKVCTHCTATFSTDRARSIHVMRIHSVPAEIAVEGGIAKRRGRRGRTGTQASKPKMHKCPNCDYVSRWKGNISRHVNAVHLALRQFPCRQCDRRFNTFSNLSVHEMTHRREREVGR